MTLTALPKRYSQCFKHIVMSPPRRLSAAFLSVLQYSQLNILLCELLWEGFPHETCCWGHRSLLGVCVRFYMALRCWMETQGLAGWLLPHQERGASDCSFPALHGSSGKAFSHFPPEKDFKKRFENSLHVLCCWLLAGTLGTSDKWSLRCWFRLQWPWLQGKGVHNSTLCNVSGQQDGEQDRNLIKHPWTSQGNQDWCWIGYQELQNCSQCSIGCG